MSVVKQILLSLVVLAIAAGGWLAYDRGTFSSGREAANAGQPRGGGPTGRGGPPGGGFGRGGSSLVVTAAVEIDNSGLEISAIGTVVAARAVTLYPQGTGVIVEVAFQPGTEVGKGQVLVRLDDADQQVAVERSRVGLAEVVSARARAERLAQSNNITTVALADAKSAVVKAEIDLKSAEIDLSKRTLAAPFAGTIGLSDVTVGDLVNSSKAIATLDDVSTVTVAFDVPERAIGRIARGQRVRATTDALPDLMFVGTVGAIDSRVDPTARTLRVQARLPNDAKVLRPGMAVDVRIVFAGEPRPVVPSLAVLWDREGSFVWKLEGDSVKRTGVRILGRRSGTVIVAADLAAGDRVIIEGLQSLREGASVAPVGAEDKAGANSGGGAPPRGPGAGAGRANRPGSAS